MASIIGATLKKQWECRIFRSDSHFTKLRLGIAGPKSSAWLRLQEFRIYFVVSPLKSPSWLCGSSHGGVVALPTGELLWLTDGAAAPHCAIFPFNAKQLIAYENR